MDEESKVPPTSSAQVTIFDTSADIVRHENWIPPELRVPEDEFFDLESIEPLRSEMVAGDGDLEMLTEIEGSGSFPEPGDVVYYKH